jgi:plasmid stabilization system protein ParE
MVFKLSIRPIALIDIDDAVAWYEKELKGLGNRFLQKLDEAFKRLSRNPQHCLIVSDPVRRILLKSFPYKILYLIEGNNTVVIIGVIHVKRSKRYIKKRLKK